MNNRRAVCGSAGPLGSQRHPPDTLMETLEHQIRRHIAAAPSRVTFHGLKKHFPRRETRSLKRAVASLLRSGQLGYTYEWGNSYLVIPIDRPFTVSKRVVLKPPNTADCASCDQVVVVLNRGGVFGLGDHPTTRLAIQLIDNLFVAKGWPKGTSSLSALDLGTGSGVLALVAAKLGADAVVAVDTDPCAVVEASANVRTNELEDRIRVRQRGDAYWHQQFGLVVANLRTPTLLSLSRQIQGVAAKDCALVFSGFRLDDFDKVQKRYEKAGFTALERGADKNWGALSLARGDLRADMPARNTTY